MDIWALIGTVIDMPTIQDPAAKAVAAFLKAKLPDKIESAIGDFVVKIGLALGGKAA